jgi:hypothetical protein
VWVVDRRARGGGEFISTMMLHGTMAWCRSASETAGMEVGEEKSWTSLTNLASTAK